MSMQTGSIDADGLARTTDGKLYVTLGGVGGATTPAGAAGFTTLLAQSYVPVTCPADVTEDTLATITVPANILGANGELKVTLFYSFTNNGNLKTIRVRYSGGAGTAYCAINGTTQLAAHVITMITNRGATNSQIGYAYGTTGTGTVLFVTAQTAAVDTTAATTVVITGQKAVNTDTLTLEGYTVEVLKP